MDHPNLNHYREDWHSQNGEDGIIAEICRRLDLRTGWFVEFGAWDGKHLSNTYNLAVHRGWQGVYIEGDPQKFQDLLKTAAQFPEKLHMICAMVGFEGENKLDDLLARTPVPKDFDLLSVDIDSYDWQVWKVLETYRPKIVMDPALLAAPDNFFDRAKYRKERLINFARGILPQKLLHEIFAFLTDVARPPKKSTAPCDLP